MTDDVKTEETENIELRIDEEPAASVKLDCSAAALNLPEQYEIDELIGQGGMGQVFKARISGVTEPVAVKVLRKELCSDAQAVKRFQQEITAVSSLSHFNIVEVFEHGITQEGMPYLTMKYIEGDSLEALLQQQGAMEWSRAVDIFLQICDALEYAHGSGTVHRDLKPSNIIVSRNESGIETAHIADFGIAKLVTAGGDTLSTLTSAGEFLGTPAYMSPEQCLGNAVDFRSDIYSFGCTMFATLTGKNPFAGCGTVETIAKKLSDDSSPELTSPAIPSKLKILIASCMNRQPRDRYASVQKLKRDLTAISKGETPDSHLVSPVLDTKAFFKRVAAFLIDYCILASAYGLASMVWFLALIPIRMMMPESYDSWWMVTFGSWAVVCIVAVVVYKAWTESRFGGTPGKLIMRLVVCNLEGKRLTLKHAFGRALMKVLIFYIFPFAIFFSIGTARQLQQASADGTIVLGLSSLSAYVVMIIAMTIVKRQFPWDLLSRTRVRRKT